VVVGYKAVVSFEVVVGIHIAVEQVRRIVVAAAVGYSHIEIVVGLLGRMHRTSFV